MTQVGSLWKVSRWLILGIVLILAGVYAGLKFLAMNKAAPTATATVNVYVLTQPVGADEPIPPSAVQVEQWPNKYVPLNAYTGPLSGVYTTEALAQGVPLVASDLFYPQSSDVIQYRLPKGDIAFDFPTSPNTGVDGVIAPGDHIALLALVPASASGATSSSKPGDHAVVFMQNVDVLAVNGALNGTATPGSGEQLILAITPKQAEALVYAEAQTSFTIVLEAPHQTLGKVPAYGAQWPNP